MKKILCVFILFSIVYKGIAQTDLKTPFEKNNAQTSTYTEGIAFYKNLAKAFPKQLQVSEVGTTDVGKPLHVAVLSFDGAFTPSVSKAKNKVILFINNAIHPGEPEGVDATMMLLRDCLQRARTDKKFGNSMNKMTVVVIPFYNVDGVLNRNSTSRANQNGPESYGFRGNAKNLDLNRDFIKCDTKNAQTFNQIFSSWQPDIFIDNHTSNGADYQYTMTVIATQKDKLNAYLADYQQNTLLPKLFESMKTKGWEMSPYVNFEETPDHGMTGFLDFPRYSTGYAALHNAIGFMPETHMLKPFPDRVWATLAFENSVIERIFEDKDLIQKMKEMAVESDKSRKIFALNWQLDTLKKEQLNFRGFEAKYKPSEVSGLPRLYYERLMPYQKKIDYFPHFTPSVLVEKPAFYVVPKAYSEVVDRLKWNGVDMTPLNKDTIIEAEFYYVTNYKSNSYPYEGHHPNRETQLEKKILKRQFYAGDWLISTNQNAARYLIETIEPQGADSFFAWNFFDGILNQKEGYSDYVFEDVAAEILKKNPDLKKQLEDKRKADPKFAASASEQLDFVYKNSNYYEPTHRLYPVARILNH